MFRRPLRRLLLLLIVVPTSALAAPHCPLTAQLPANMVSESRPGGEAIIAFRPANGGFPTFNIVCFAGKFAAASENTRAIADAVSNQYRAIGLTSTKILSSQLMPQIGGTETILSYTARGQNYTSAVLVVPFSGSHAIATFISPEASWEVNQSVYKEILDSMTNDEAGKQLEPARGGYPSVVLISIMLLVIGLALIGTRAYRKWTNASPG